MIERVIRIAHTFEEAEAFDREDIVAMSMEERISGVERLRKVWLGEDPSQSRLERILVCADRPSSALRLDPFGAAAPSPRLLTARDKVFILGRKPWRIDILTGIDGVSFREAWAGRVEVQFATSPLFVIGRDALIKNKRAAGRPKDLLDVERLEATPSRALPAPRRRKRSEKRTRRARSRAAPRSSR
jgi:hypothetical protein